MASTGEIPYLFAGILYGGLPVYNEKRICTVHDTENLTFSADDRTENPHIFARTISGFRAEQLASSSPIMIFRTILTACFSIL